MFLLLTASDGSKIVVQSERIQKITLFQDMGSITFENSNGGGGVSCKEKPEEIFALLNAIKP